MTIATTTIDSPVGTLTIAVRDDHLVALTFPGDWPRKRAALTARHAGDRCEATTRLARWTTPIEAYFRGDIAALDDLPVAPVGTPFQIAVWLALRSVPAGATATYADLARHIGRPTAFRAVGAANGANPIAIVLPCHRIIGTSGALTGYGGGLDRKRWLLTHEAASATASTVGSAGTRNSLVTQRALV